ncbi:hypothetical protein D915_001934 [Fasciola hepatica]|uniref:Peptidase S54 rhomboid domain-containing protein n=1 Tax=Fasciola hepatica TaxID=6192 RepID=A0A4E0RYC1_FASHE|nr:hypothetical protein D915_001934 [Fasciola hepatica]
MWGFADHRSPDQGYRVILSIFIHTNLPHLFLSLLIQLFALRPFEEYMGWHKMAVMFISSCIFGNFLSSFVHPYQIATGPAHMGLLTVRLVDFLCFQHLLEKSRSGIMHMVLPLIFLLFLGFSPWLDNVANFGSVLIALLLYFILIYHTRCILRILLTCGLTGLFIMVCMLFYRGPIVQCEWCRHLTCAPLTPGLCDEFQVSVETQLDCIPLNWE